MITSVHRINTILELAQIPYSFGIEIDLRDYDNDIILSHDPYNNNYNCTTLIELMQFYNHKFIILNIKSERIEHKVIEIMKRYGVDNYMLLDSSFPMIYKLAWEGYGDKLCVRYSKYEKLDYDFIKKYNIGWVWVDCFDGKNPLNKFNYNVIKKELNMKVCIVSPELQNYNSVETINEYKLGLIENNMSIDMICTKNYNTHKWEELKIINTTE